MAKFWEPDDTCLVRPSCKFQINDKVELVAVVRCCEGHAPYRANGDEALFAFVKQENRARSLEKR